MLRTLHVDFQYINDIYTMLTAIFVPATHRAGHQPLFAATNAAKIQHGGNRIILADMDLHDAGLIGETEGIGPGRARYVVEIALAASLL